MTNTPLQQILNATLSQIRKNPEKVGAEYCKNFSTQMKSLQKHSKIICKKSNLPIIADIHFHYKRAIESAS